MKLIVGLGNPGKQYLMTRHNFGFLVIDHIAESHGVPVTSTGFDAVYGRGRIGDIPVLLAKPQSFMNRSGFSVSRFFEYFKIADHGDIAILHDDLDLPFGTIRLKTGGGHGGHRGLRSILEHLGGSDFQRVRLGIGRPAADTTAEEYVLNRFPPVEMKQLPSIVQTAGEAVVDMLTLGIQTAMNKYHGTTINYFNEEV